MPILRSPSERADGDRQSAECSMVEALQVHAGITGLAAAAAPGGDWATLQRALRWCRREPPGMR
jgi:hypothetical protein